MKEPHRNLQICVCHAAGDPVGSDPGPAALQSLLKGQGMSRVPLSSPLQSHQGAAGTVANPPFLHCAAAADSPRVLVRDESENAARPAFVKKKN